MSFKKMYWCEMITKTFVELKCQRSDDDCRVDSHYLDIPSKYVYLFTTRSQFFL